MRLGSGYVYDTQMFCNMYYAIDEKLLTYVKFI